MLSQRRECFALLLLLATGLAAQAAPARLSVLFLGDNAAHRPADRFRQLAPVLKKRGIDLTYTDKTTDLNAANLAKYDGLIVYANHTKITPDQEKALLDYVGSGKGFIPLHCASYCFLNSPEYIALVGAQFRSHTTGTFRATPANTDHPIMQGYKGFSSWDETYVHTKHNEKGRAVLEYRVEGDVKEPWTWVRTHGKGRVFYTAWGHDQRTWGHPGFQNLVERGLRWACNDSTLVPAYADAPEMTKLAKNLPPLQFKEAKVPFYPAGERWGTIGKPISKMQLPLSPEESMKHMVTPVDFEVKLFADEKLLGGKPICMTWDERGRLWASITRDYPNERQREGQGRDRIVVVEDTDGDGVADKVTTFADKLSIPTSIAFHKGGVIVHQAPHTLYLKDTDGDGVADERKVLFTGWDTRDTHAGPSNLNYGLDNWLYGMVGYSGYRGTIGGERHSFQQGFYRFKPDGSKMEFLRNTNNNSWGVGFSEEGLLFGSTANGNPSEYLPIPNRYYESVRGWSSSVLRGIAGNAPMHPIMENVRQVDHHGRFTAAAGHALYTARTYPREYWNQTAFVTEPTGHLVATFQLQREGSDFRSRNAWNLFASDDEWCSPIMAEVGPDGNVWILDWYNFIVQHNPTPAGYKTGRGNAYESDLRDKTHGRVYRLVHKKGAATKPMTLKDATPQQLVAALTNDNMFWRRHAQRLLVESGNKDVVPELVKLIRDEKVDAVGLNPGAIHALWTLHGLGVMADKDPSDAAFDALIHPSAGVRRNAVLVLPPTGEASNKILISGALIGPDAQVRLAAYLAVASMPACEELGKAVAVYLAKEEDMSDRWLPDAITSAAAAHAPGFLTTAAGTKLPSGSRAQSILTTVAVHYAAGGPADSIDKVVQALAKAQPAVAESMLTGLARGWKGKGPTKLADETSKALATLFNSPSATTRANVLRLATTLGSKGLEGYLTGVVKTLLDTAANNDSREADRIAAAKQLVELQPASDDAVTQLLALLSPRTSPGLTDGILDAVALSQAPKAGQTVVERLAELTPSARTTAIRVLLGRAASTKVLLDAVEKGTLKLTDLALDQKQALAAHPNKAIRAVATKLLAKGGDLPSPDRQKVVEKFMPLIKKKGDAAKGKAVFKNQCAKCHVHSGEGTTIGPDLTGMATHPKEELLIHVMDPSRSVEGNFRVYSVTTVDGKVFSGMLASETRTSVELVDAEAKRVTVQRDAIEQLSGSPKSLMPEGFEKQLKEDEVVDLLEFLTLKGKYLPLPLDKVATVSSSQGMFFSKTEPGERLVFADWKPKTFKGVPFHVVDPREGKANNVILLYGPQGSIPPTMPKSVSLPCNTAAKAVHLLSGISGWGHPLGTKGSVSMIVRLHYADGTTEDHELKNGQHFADYIRRVNVPDSEFAFNLRGRQIRYLAVTPKRPDTIAKIELVKGPDDTAPIVMAVTVEPR